MLKIQLLAVAVFAVCAFSALAATSAFALTSQVLCDSVTITTEAQGEACLGQVEGEVLLEESTKKPNIDCKVVQEDTNLVPHVGGVDILVVKAELLGCVALGLIGTPECTVTLDNLPWLIEINLVGGLFIGLILSGGTGAAGWNATCLLVFSGLCEAILPGTTLEDYAVDLSNQENGNIDVLFLEAEKGKCNTGGEGFVTGLVEVLSALTLALSEA